MLMFETIIGYVCFLMVNIIFDKCIRKKISVCPLSCRFISTNNNCIGYILYFLKTSQNV